MIKNLYKLFPIISKALAITVYFYFSLYGFGKNKVQYENLKWNYYTTPHFTIYFHQNQGILPNITAQWLENAYANLYNDFGYKIKKTVPLLIYGSPTLFEQTNVTPSIIPEGVGGFTESLKNRIVVPFTGTYDDYRHVLHHELVHAFQFSILMDQFGGSIFTAGAVQMPLWFAEGSAEFLSSGWDSEADMFLMDRAIFSSLPLPGNEMNDFMVYKGGQSFLFFLSSSRGDTAFHQFLSAFRRTRQVINSVELVYKNKLEDLGREWHQELKRIYWPEIGKRENLDKKGTALTSHTESRSYFNLKPRISPDGSMVAYYSDAKDYTKIFITDTKGEVLYKIGEYGYGGYFESFQPFRSGMCWSPKSDRLAFVTKNKGRNEIRIVNVKKKKHIVTLTPDLASISSPDWSPDGKHLVFCGLDQYRANIYMINIRSGKLTQLTNDISYESDPRFSRDGSAIIFAALDTCGFADRNNAKRRPSSDLYLLELKDKSINRLTSSPWNEKQPCFSPDGNKIAFISDRNGINNIYIAPINALDSAKALTDIIGGCSDPDWSIEGNNLVFCLFQKQGWDIWLIDEPAKKLFASTPSPTLWVKSQTDSSTHYFLPAPISIDSAETPGISEISKKDQSLITIKKRSKKTTGKDTIGIIEEEAITSKDSSLSDTIVTVQKDTAGNDVEKSLSYNDSLATTLPDSAGTAKKTDRASTMSDTIIQPDTSEIKITSVSGTALDTTVDTIVLGVKRKEKDTSPSVLPKDLVSNPYKLKFTVDVVSAGVALSTMYGYGGGGIIVLSDLLGNQQIALALNLQGSFDQNNFFASYLNTEYRLDFGIGGFYERYFGIGYTKLYHDTDYGFMALLRYPFSLFTRLDLNLFYQHLDRIPYTVMNNKLVKDTSEAAIHVNITLPSLSFVFDNILWGITGPVNGVRADASLLVAPPFRSDDASFISFDVDIRHYFHIMRKFVWANRITCGFSEPMGRDESQRRYFLGGNENWLFWNVNIREYEKNLSNTIYSTHIVPFRGWNYFDITGTRYAVFNTEFRFPFVKEIDMVWPLPATIRYINGAFFMDLGNAWDPEDQYDIIPLPQKIFGGLGFGLRANLGIFILRYDLAWKTDWHRYAKDAKNYFSLGAEF